MGVSLKKISGSSEEIDYPWKEVEQARIRDEYLREHGRSNVSWIGDAQALGFGAEPTQEDAHLLLNGMTADGELLLPKAVVQALDLTFGLGKAVSIVNAVGGPEIRALIAEAREEAIVNTLEVFKRDYLRVRRGSGRREAEREVVPATGLVGIRYEHPYNREGDPHDHDHVVISTVVRNPDGGHQRMWIADMREVLRGLGYRHEAEQREALSRRIPGIEWGPVQENGSAHLVQVPESLVTAMSRRANAIKEATREWELANGRRANSAVKQAITLETRPAKPDVPDRAKWVAEQTAIADAHGLTQSVIREQILEAEPASWQKVPSVGQLADRLLGPNGLTATATTFRRTDVMVAVIQAGVIASQVDGCVERILADSRAIAIQTLKGVTYVTEAHLRAEESIVRAVVDGIGAVPHLVVEHDVAQTEIDSLDFELTEGQREVVIATAVSPDRVVLIEAGAGTGKTTAAGVIRAALEAQGFGVRGVAPTGKAAVELAAGAGLDARTVDSLLRETDRGGSLSDGGRYQTLIVDEGGMVDTRKFARLLAYAERDGMKVVVMGDSSQLTSVAPGGWLGYFTRSGIRPALRLVEIVRQRDPAHRKAVMDLSHGRPGTWIKYQKDRGNILHLGAGQEHQYGTRAAELLCDAAGRHGWNHVLAITPTNMRREFINEHVQQARLARGELGQLLAESGEHELFHVGDRVMFIGRNDRRRNLQNGLIGTVTGKTEQGELVIALNEKHTQVRTLTAEQVKEHVRLAYAVTAYKGQATTVEEAVMVAAPQELNLNRGYVPASRPREQTKLLLISDNTPDGALETLAKHLRIREDDELAIEHIDKAKEANMTQADQTKRAPARSQDPNKWLSEHRPRIEQLDRERAQIDIVACLDTDEHDGRIREIEDRQRRIRVEDSYDYGLIRKPGRKDREQQRDRELRDLEQEWARLRADAAAVSREAGESFATWQRITGERRDLVTLAAKEEFEQRIGGKHAPWVYEAIGPKPPVEQKGLIQRWYRVGEHLAGVRVDRGITDPVATGIAAEDVMLINDIRTLRGHTEQAREARGEPRQFSLMESKEYRPGRLELPGLRTRDRGRHGYEIGG
jgi:conjugative relaxase-like TrwC/TraI family protein